ncbi:uncharacterized protein LOC118781974 [Megalops cyprinoides]|uniref:uncharacterized protein LOC118781974 n=1 Tax=Megalops cyprinoides TaxID=118141 RepID=UPI00186414D9|nr:uncharacterized protein LOC118781974 [Megalops cyprinoides]
MLNDRTTKTKQIFEIIANRMEAQGFLISQNSWKAGERCFQKWRNMERTYKDYVLARKKTDAGRRKQPEFFEQFHALMGQRLSLKLAAAADSPARGAGANTKAGAPPPAVPLYAIVVPASQPFALSIPSTSISESENHVHAGITKSKPSARKSERERIPHRKLLQANEEKEETAEKRVQKKKRRSWLGENRAVENGDDLLEGPEQQITSQDIEATEALVELYGSPEIQGLIRENKTRTKRIFEIIASRLKEQGFPISDMPERAGERCFQKWRNLSRAYKEYVLHPEKPDAVKRKPPPCFEQLQDLIGQRLSLQLSTTNSSPAPDEGAEEEQEGTCQSLLNAVESLSNPAIGITLPSSSSPSSQAGSHLSLGPSGLTAKRKKLVDVAELLQEYREEARRREQEKEKRAEERFQQLRSMLEQQHTEQMALMKELINAFKKN